MTGSGWPARYEIRVDSVLDDQWADWFGGLQLSSDGTQTVITGVLADQVVQPVPARSGLGEQILVIQRLQAVAGSTQAGAVQGSRGVAVDVGAGVEPQPPKQPLLVRGQVPVRQVERGGHRQVLRRHQL